ncbi:MAG: uncharacterized protein QOG97_1858 [Acidimicrobiaceae bacterium]|nr:uncharacterized protein [Acidimicrobiaceae bacterium]
MTARRSPLEVEGRKTVSAGQAIVVALLAMVMAAFLNADSLVASIEGQSFGTSRSIGLSLARPTKTISHWTGLNLPRKLIDELAEHQPPRVALPKPLPLPRTPPSTSANGAPVSTTTTTVAPRRAPTAQQPLKVWLAGDSLMGTIAESFIEKTGGNPLFAAGQDFRISTGLARPDVYDWPAAISREIASAHPDVVILIFGANDDQGMQADGHGFALQSPEWQQEYARRVNGILDSTADGVRQVIWLGLPAVRRPRLNQTKDYINEILKTAAQKHPNVTYVDPGPILDGAGNSFTTYLTNSSGTAITVREADGIHITKAGADLVTPTLLADIDQVWHLPH